jgi:ABC-type uncharacterized transport system permease subunit
MSQLYSKQQTIAFITDTTTALLVHKKIQWLGIRLIVICIVIIIIIIIYWMVNYRTLYCYDYNSNGDNDTLANCPYFSIAILNI